MIVFPLIALISGLIFFQVSYSNSGAQVRHQKALSILSYNTRFFRTSNTYDEFSYDLINWVSSDSSDLKCIQEYCTNPKIDKLDVTSIVSANRYKSFVFLTKDDSSEHGKGLAIFSKYAFLDTGFVWKSSGSFNAGMFADIKINEDTVRIYNVHLESMGIVLRDYKEIDNYLEKLETLIRKLKYGAEVRSNQIDMLVTHTKNCPYPFIICGDFNETPFSYNYFKLRSHFQNSFEEAGNGFGFSFNSILFFLRIDHHFFNPEIQALNYRVDRSIKISDHFPIRGYYKPMK